MFMGVPASKQYGKELFVTYVASSIIMLQRKDLRLKTNIQKPSLFA